jgi:hypothetical protein
MVLVFFRLETVAMTFLLLSSCSLTIVFLTGIEDFPRTIYGNVLDPGPNCPGSGAEIVDGKTLVNKCRFIPSQTGF